MGWVVGPAHWFLLSVVVVDGWESVGFTPATWVHPLDGGVFVVGGDFSAAFNACFLCGHGRGFLLRRHTCRVMPSSQLACCHLLRFSVLTMSSPRWMGCWHAAQRLGNNAVVVVMLLSFRRAGGGGGQGKDPTWGSLPPVCRAVWRQRFRSLDAAVGCRMPGALTGKPWLLLLLPGTPSSSPVRSVVGHSDGQPCPIGSRLDLRVSRLWRLFGCGFRSLPRGGARTSRPRRLVRRL